MKSAFTQVRAAFPFMFIGLSYCVLYLVVNSKVFFERPQVLSLGVTLDLICTIPLFYFLIIRNRAIPKVTAIPVLILGLVLGNFILPAGQLHYLELFKVWGLPILELTVLTAICVKTHKAIREFKRVRQTTPDFFTTIKHACAAVLPSLVVPVFAAEIAVIYYGFINWEKRRYTENEYTYHKKSGISTILMAFVFIIGLETLALHLLLSIWSSTAAWIVTALSIYTALQLFGFSRSLSKRPIVRDGNRLLLKYGILSETEIHIQDIDRIELSRKELPKDKNYRKLSPFDNFETHNVIIYTSKEHTLHGLYGIKKSYKALALFVDDAVSFKNHLVQAGDKLLPGR